MEGAMPPTPKRNPARRNRSSTAATLRAADKVKVPPLPDRAMPWHSHTEQWWADVWSSPMAPEYDSSDIHGLYLLAVLVDAFWAEPSKELAGEIRLQRQCFGLTPLDRRRLQWEIERTDAAQARGSQRRAGAKAPAKRADPRGILRAVE
jgi:hypothetical protein